MVFSSKPWKVFIFFMFLLVVLPLTVAYIPSESLGVFKSGENVELLQLCSNETSLCDSCNISSVVYPNSSTAITNVAMNKREGDFNYILNSNYTKEIGRYSVNGFCNAGSSVRVFSYFFDVTTNGNEKPDGIVIVIFILLFTVFVVGLLGLLLYNIFHLIQWDFDAKDLTINISAYFALFVTYILGKEYLGNSFIDGFLVWMIGVTATTNVVLPIIAFFISYVKGGLGFNEK